jgi:malto-oligosyltrehalose trehalohydrolase
MAAMRRRYELPFGAEPAAGGVRFRLWSPRAHAASVQLEGGRSPQPMQSEPGGWFSLTTDRAGPGSRYKYVVDGRAFPDPASRFQPDGVHGASEVIDACSYSWSDADWRGVAWEEAIVYELHLGTFSESGDCAGAISHLDELYALGVTVVELMPVAAFPGSRNWGYDGVQLFAPAACYGRPDDLKALVEACHARGLAIMLDVVYNHFGPEGNYLHTIAPDFFTDRHNTPWGAAINYDGPNSRPVRDFMISNALYWLEEFHFDGLRLDAVHAIADESNPDIVTEIGAIIRSRIPDRPIHLVLENDRNEARRLARDDSSVTGYTAQWNDDFHHALHVLVTGETAGYYADVAEHPAAMLGRALATGFAFQGEPSAFRGGEPRGERSDGLPATAFVSFLQNHDQIGNTPFGTRIAQRAPEAAVHAAIAIVLLSPQVPLLFMGEEWACSRPFTFFCDLSPPLDEAVRQGRRREFAQYPEFADPAAQARIPDATAPATFENSKLDWAERNNGVHAQWLARYRRLIEIRRREIVPRLAAIASGGDCRLLGSSALRVEWRLGDNACLTLLANVGDMPAALPTRTPGRLLYATAEPPSSSVPPLSAAFFLEVVS